jgi:hypothetical protein
LCDPTENPATGISQATYLQERSTLIEMEQKNAEQHDKTVLAISMGGLALSITFLKEIAPHPQPETLIWIELAWACFVASLLTILASFLTGQWACRKHRDYLDLLYLGERDGVASTSSRWSRITDCFNVVSYILVFLAVGFLAYFSCCNLK